MFKPCAAENENGNQNATAKMGTKLRQIMTQNCINCTWNQEIAFLHFKTYNTEIKVI